MCDVINIPIYKLIELVGPIYIRLHKKRPGYKRNKWYEYDFEGYQPYLITSENKDIKVCWKFRWKGEKTRFLRPARVHRVIMAFWTTDDKLIYIHPQQMNVMNKDKLEIKIDCSKCFTLWN